MKDWNVAVSIHERKLKRAFDLLEEFGRVNKSEFFNVLVMKVYDIQHMLETLRKRIAEEPEILEVIARLMPVTHTFNFQVPEEFEEKAKEVVSNWIEYLAGKDFYVRIHRRGFKGRLSSTKEEQFLDRYLMESAGKRGNPAHVTFDNPDVIIAIETIGQRAGLSIWNREELGRYPFLRLD